MSEAPLVRALEARYYTDPEIFAAEHTGLFRRTWQYAGHVSEVEKPGDYFAFELAGESLFCLRQKDGTLAAFYNVCQHRAHELVSGSGNARVIVCPYHAWTYELDGRLRSGPNVKATLGTERMADICLTPVKVENFHGFIFVNLDPKAEPMETWFPNVQAELGTYVPDMDKLAPLKRVEVDEKCNWKVSVENYSECYHCALNHPTFATGVIKPSTYDIRPQGFCLRHTTECQNLDRMTYPIDLEANDKAGSYSSWFLWPTFSFQVYPGNVLNTYHWQPRTVEEVTVTRGWYTEGGKPSEVIESLARQDRDTTVAEDITLVESVQRGLNSTGYTPGPLVLDPAGGVNSEHSIATLHGWMREAVGQISP